MELRRVIDSHVKLAWVALGYRLRQLFHHGPIIVHYQHNTMTKKNHICSFLTLLFLKSLCQSSIFTQHKILTYWKQKHPSLLLLQKKFPWSYNHNNYYYNNIIKTIDGTLWKLTLTMPNIMNYCALVAQLVEQRAVTWEVVSSTLTGPTLRGPLKITE